MRADRATESALITMLVTVKAIMGGQLLDEYKRRIGEMEQEGEREAGKVYLSNYQYFRA